MDTRNQWSENSEARLINLYASLKDGDKITLWTNVHRGMGGDLSVGDCKTRWKSLINRYIQVKTNKASKKEFVHFKAMDAILKSDDDVQKQIMQRNNKNQMLITDFFAAKKPGTSSCTKKEEVIDEHVEIEENDEDSDD